MAVRRYGFWKEIQDLRLYRNPDPTKPKWTRLIIPADYVNKKLCGWNQKHAKDQSASRFGCNPWGNSDYLNADGLLYGVACVEVLESGAYLHPAADYSLEWHFLWDSWVKSSLCNWSHDKQNQKYSYEFYLDNDAEENNPLLAYDDGAYWTLVGCNPGGGTANIDGGEDTATKIRGNSSYRIHITPTGGNYEWLAAKLDFSPALDLTNYDFWCIWWYGANSLKNVFFLLKTTGVDWYRWAVLDNWSGWRRLILPIRSPHTTWGNPSLSSITHIQIDFYPNEITDRTHYIDRTLFDYAKWIRVEARVPDALAYGSEGQPESWAASIYYWDVNSSSYQPCLRWNPYQSGSDSWRWMAQWKFLDGTSISAVNPSSWQSYVEGFTTGLRGQSGLGVWGNTSINYTNRYGCMRRIGFAFKMPPEDYLDSATGGVSQLKLKLEVKYSGLGKATYEFEDSSNEYYGLRNINKKYIILLRNESSGPVDFIQLKNTTVGDGLPNYLTVTADHDQNIHEVLIRLPNVADTSRKHWGQSTKDPTLDQDNDGILDVIEEVEAFIDQGGWS